MSLLPFDLTDPLSILTVLLVALGAFLVMRACTRDIMVNELELFVMTNITMSFSIALIYGYWNIGTLFTPDFLLILQLIGAFYGAIFVTAKLLRTKALKSRMREDAAKAMASDPQRNTALLVAFAVGFPVLMSTSLASLQGGLNAQYGVLRDAGPLRILLEGGIPLFLFFAFASNIVARKFLNVPLTLAVILIGPLGGAKSALLATILTYFTVSGMFREEITVRRLLKYSPILALALPTMLVPFLLQGNSVETGAFASAIRFLLSGDVYFYTFVAARPEQFYNFYDWGSYLMHPFLMLMGQRAYDLPLGAALLSHFIGQYTLSGPNPHAAVLGLILFNGNSFLATTFCVALGILTTLMRHGAFRVYSITQLPPAVRSLIAAPLTFIAPVLFLDLGTAERYMLSYLIVSALILGCGLLLEIVRKTSPSPQHRLADPL